MKNSYYKVSFLNKNSVIDAKEFFVSSEKAARFAALEIGAKAIYSVNLVKENIWSIQYHSMEYKMGVLNALKFQFDSNVPVLIALNNLIASETNEEKRHLFEKSVSSINRGGSLADAIEATGIYNASVIDILRGSEKVGPSIAIGSAISFLESNQSYIKQVVSTLSLLSIEISTAITIPFGIQSFGIPYVKEYIESESPNDSAVYMEKLSDIALMNNIWIAFTYGTIIFASLLLSLYIVNKQFREKILLLLNKVPLLSDFIIKNVQINLLKIGSSMLISGATIPEVIDKFKVISKNPAIKKTVETISDNMASGKNFSESCMGTDFFSKSEIVVISAHRNYAQLSEIFKSIAENKSYQLKKTGVMLFHASVWITIAYILVSGIIAFNLFSLFNEVAQNSLDSMGNI